MITHLPRETLQDLRVWIAARDVGELCWLLLMLSAERHQAATAQKRSRARRLSVLVRQEMKRREKK